MTSTRTSPGWRSALAAVGPGVLVTATGVGAGDLLTASLAGSRHGLALLWAVWVGALLKWFLNEGLTRWQMATDTTLVEGWLTRLGPWIRWLFGGYLLIWTVFTAGALMNACGVAGTGLLPLAADLRVSKIVWGALHSVVGVVLVWRGGFKLFERVMAACIAVMFVTVVTTAVLLGPDFGATARGLFVPQIPQGSLAYLLGVLGGVGGTVTLMSYGYWIREKGRSGAAGLRTSRIDLGVGYVMTALFGVAMIVIGSRLSLSRGPTVALELAGQLEAAAGPAGRWIFLLGFWGAVFSSLLGVWQSVPYLVADLWRLRRAPSAATRDPAPNATRSAASRTPDTHRDLPEHRPPATLANPSEELLDSSDAGPPTKGSPAGAPAADADARAITRGSHAPAARLAHGSPTTTKPGRSMVEVDLTRTTPYRVYLVGLAILPLPLLWLTLERAQLAYAVLGSLFMPLLALTLLLMNNRRAWVGSRFRNGWLANAALSATLLFFTWVAVRRALQALLGS